MCMECGHIVQERAILTANAHVEVRGQNVRSIMCVCSMVTLQRYVVKMSGPSCLYKVVTLSWRELSSLLTPL